MGIRNSEIWLFDDVSKIHIWEDKNMRHNWIRIRLPIQAHLVSLCSLWNLIYRITELCWVLNFRNGDIWRVVGSERLTDLCWFLRLLPNQSLLLQILCMTLSPQVWKSSTPYLSNIVNLVYLCRHYVCTYLKYSESNRKKLWVLS